MPEKLGAQDGRRPVTEQFELFEPWPLAAMKGPAWSQLPDEIREAATKLMARLLLDHGLVACGPEGGRHDVR
ncbi:MAG: hypothetical protein JOZ93_11015 [Sinobacteraceae bacterium]|nr:hypothetical protein [Nevskiaceae bacterium]